MLSTFSLRFRTYTFWHAWLVLLFAGSFIWLPAPHAEAAIVQPRLWTTNGSVNTLALANNRLYLGGTFSYVGPATGNLAAIDAVSGSPDLSFARVTGQVMAIAPDGSNGWFIGGTFTAVSGVPRQNLAHIRADKTLDLAWNPGVSADPQSSPAPGIFTMQVSNNTVYIGGNFTTAGGQPRNYLAALDATTGAPKAWNPSPDIWVYSLALNGSTVYFSGLFTSVGGQNRNFLAAVDATTGALASWNPNSNTPVNVIAVHNNIVYAGGFFTQIGGASRSSLAALDPITGLATSWVSDADASIYALAFKGNTLYIGGDFTFAGGQSRNRIAALDITTGAATSWNPNASNTVQTLAIIGSTIYIGGGFSTVGGQQRKYLAAIDAATGAVGPWNPNPDNAVRTLAAGGSTIYAGGNFGLVGGVERSSLAALDITTGRATDWKPNLAGSLYAMSVAHNTLFIGGDITTVEGKPRSNLASFDLSSGALTDWNPGINGFGTPRVWSLAASGGQLYIGGDFATAAGQARNNLAAFDIATGALANWNPGTSGSVVGTVFALAAEGPTVYAGGIFSSVGGQVRKGIAAIEAASGNVTSWNPQLDGVIRTLAIRDTRIYAGGSFTSTDGQSHKGLVALDAATGLALPAATPDTTGSVTTLVIHDDQVYVGGYFDTIGGAPRTNIAVFDATNGVITALNPNLNGGVNTLAFDTGTLYLGGEFTRVDTEPQHYLGGISIATAATTQPATNISARSAMLNGLVNANGATTTTSFELSTAPGDYSAARTLAGTPAVASGDMPIAVNALASDLNPGTTYYYRVIATTGAGAIIGAEQKFKTLEAIYIPIMRR